MRLESLATALKTAYMKGGRTWVDAMAWMVKALGSAKRPKHRPLIEEVAARSTESKVVSYAKKALGSY